MATSNSTIGQTIVGFHTGRGGRFYNAGHVSFIGECKISDFTNNLFSRFENESNFKDRFGFDFTGDKNQKCILDLITDREFEDLEEKFGITLEMLGEEQYYNNENPVGLTEAESDSGIGVIDIDGEYDTTVCLTLEDCSDEELQLIVDSENLPGYFCSDDIIEFAKESLGIVDEEIEEN